MPNLALRIEKNLMPSFRSLPWFVSAFLVVATSNEPVRAWQASELFAAGPNPLIVKTEGRKGTRLYTPVESEDYDAMVEGEEKAAATREPTAEERLEECMASWDDKTHITKSSWRLICQRQIRDDE